MTTLQLIGLVSGEPHPEDGRFVVSYDPDYHLPDGSYDGGKLVTSMDIKDAMVFASVNDALHYWHRGPSCLCHRLRPDGMPNCPLTAFNAAISTAAETTFTFPMVWQEIEL